MIDKLKVGQKIKYKTGNNVYTITFVGRKHYVIDSGMLEKFLSIKSALEYYELVKTEPKDIKLKTKSEVNEQERIDALACLEDSFMLIKSYLESLKSEDV